jgi:uncharacterized protein (TIGR02145 family)
MCPYRLLFFLAVCLPSLAFAQSSPPCAWNPDFDGDNAIGVNDLLALLGVFEEVDSDGDGIFDSQDDCVGNYDACGVCNGTGVDADTDGICDDVDPCVGALDECGVCNGPGPLVPVIDEIVYVTDSLFVPPLGTWYVFSYAVDTLYTYVCPVQGCTDTQASNFNPLAVIEDGSCTYGPDQCGGQPTVTFDGYTYNLVGIGTQCWFKENLRSDNYRNGDAIPGELSDAQWSSRNSGAQTVYNNDAANLATYGRLYNWYATQDSRGLCPTGFHVPSDGEWMTLEMALGMTQSQENEWGWRGSDQGTQLKAAPSDIPSWNGSNTIGFSGSPAGYRNNSGGFSLLGNFGIWWSSSPSGGNAIKRSLRSEYSGVFRSYTGPLDGFSVRCVRDAEIGLCFDPDTDGICAENEVSGCSDSTASNFNPEATEEDNSCEFPVPAQCGGQSAVTFDGHTYALVGIGTQCWFKENLRSDHYRNGDAIPGELSNSSWQNTTSGAQAVYNNDVANLATYGRLYNWYATQDSRGLCPTGFHVPSDWEWKALEMALGMTQSQANEWGWRGTDEGTQLKSSPMGYPSWNGSNTSRFSGLPAGNRSNNGPFNGLGDNGYWWSSSPNEGYAIYRYLNSGNSYVSRLNELPPYGFSVRCVRD